MNRKEECNIVKDLLPQYMEDLLSDESKTFVSKHLENCNSCKNYYEKMKSNLESEEKQEELDEEVEINFLKKLKKSTKLWKKILLMILIIFAIIGSFIFIKYNKISKVLDNSKLKLLELENHLNNYKLVQKQINKNYKDGTNSEITTTYYYKDGKSKKVYENVETYISDNSYEKINVYNDLKQIDYITQNYIDQRKGTILNLLEEGNIDVITGIYRLAFSIREDEYDNQKCYVIRFGNSKNYREVWKSKSDFITVKMIEESEKNYYKETTFKLIKNIVKDEDVDTNILETEQFGDYKKNIINTNVNEKTKKVYEKVYQ